MYTAYNPPPIIDLENFKYLMCKTFKDGRFIKWPIIVLVLVISIVSPSKGYGQSEAEAEAEQVSIKLSIPHMGDWDIEVLVRNEHVYISVSEFFDLLKIKNKVAADLQAVTGFFISPKATYNINGINKTIIYNDTTYHIPSGDIIETATGIYLKAEVFGKVFGLGLPFNFRNLSMNLVTKVLLPAVLEIQQQQMRDNISKLKGDKKADTTIAEKFARYKLGMADWALSTTLAGKQSTVRAGLNMGAIIMGGETNVNLNFDNTQHLSLDQQYYKWRYVNNSHAALRQITVGKMSTASILSLYSPINGIQFTNATTTARHIFGTYRITDRTEPEWTVELYVNNILVDYLKADAAGFYTFDIPLVYGGSDIKLRFYGPFGEQRMQERNINIPFVFLPVHLFEYTMTTGIVSDSTKGFFARANLNYGLAKHLTIGGGTEYLSSIKLGEPMPYVNASFRLGEMTMFMEHALGVKSVATINYRLASSIDIDMGYIQFQKGQTIVRQDYLEDRSFGISMPINLKSFNGYSQFSYHQLIYAQSRTTNATFLFSTRVAGVGTSISTYATFTGTTNSGIYSTCAVTLPPIAGVRLSPQFNYEYNTKTIGTLRVDGERRLGRNNYLNVSYQQGATKNTTYVTAGLRFNLPFAQAAFFVVQNNQSTQVSQSANGSLVYNREKKFIGFTDRPNIGSGGLIIAPFLDMNCNGKRDAGEPKVFGLNVHSSIGQIKTNDNDTTIRITGAEAYADCFIDLDNSRFESIAWQLSKKSIRIKIEPNVLGVIEVPVAVVGEVSGNVFFKDAKGENGMGRMIVNLYRSDSVFIKRMITEQDGYFDYIGLVPGNYYATIDNDQMLKLKMLGTPAQPFKIALNKDGDIVGGLKFVVQSSVIKSP